MDESIDNARDNLLRELETLKRRVAEVVQELEITDTARKQVGEQRRR